MRMPVRGHAGGVGTLVLLAACVSAAVFATAQAYSCDGGVLQLKSPQDSDNCYAVPLSNSSIKAVCLSAARVRVTDGVIKIVPLVTESFKYRAFLSSTEDDVRFNCKDMNASGLYFPGSTTSATVMLFDDFGGPLSNLTKTGADQITLSSAHSYNYESYSNCQYNYTVVQGCVLGVKAPAKPPVSCPTGSYKKTGRFQISYCAPCTPGTFSSKVGGACKPCPAGTHSSTLGSTKCTKCYPGSFSKAGAVECNSCGLYDNKWTDGKKCLACPKGSYKSGSNPAQCVKCHAGKKCCTVGWNKDCPKCTDGSAAGAAYTSLFALEGTAPSSCLTTGHALCAPKINITVDGPCTVSINNLQYTNNPDVNTYCPWSKSVPVQGPQFSITDLAKFDWYPDNSSLLSGNFTAASSPYISVFIPVTKCTLRYRALTAPAATILGAAPKPGKATICPAGQYLESKTDAKPGPCLLCPPGHYSPRPTSSGNCLRCPVGTYAYGYGNKQCKQCPSGQASKQGATYCTYCDLGFQPRPRGKGCVPCPKGSVGISYRGAGGRCLANQLGTVCCASGNCKGQTPCKLPLSIMSEDDTAHIYTGVLQLLSKSLPQPSCKNATFLSCLLANGKLQVYSNSAATLNIDAYRTAFSCANYTNTYYGGYTSTKYAYVTSYEEAAGGRVAFGLASDSTKGTVTMYLSPFVWDDYVSQIPAKASADCSATFKLISGYVFDLTPPKGAKCDPADSVQTYDGRQFCIACFRGYFKNSTGLCQRCPSGSYSDPGATDCKPCPAGYSCYDAASSPGACGNGYYSSKPGQAECTECPANTYSTDSFVIPTSKCTACPKGTVSPKGAVACGVDWDKAFPA